MRYDSFCFKDEVFHLPSVNFANAEFASSVAREINAPWNTCTEYSKFISYVCFVCVPNRAFFFFLTKLGKKEGNAFNWYIPQVHRQVLVGISIFYIGCSLSLSWAFVAMGV